MIDYAKELNAAQLDAVTTLEGPVLVIAGAGSGKTRTIVYRLANLVEHGVPASSILLLTFTRKAARAMLERAQHLLEQRGIPHGLASVQGGTFHAYAYAALRLFRPEGYAGEATVMDSADSLAALAHCKETLRLGKGESSFPKTPAIQAFISKSRNRESDLEEILSREAPHLLPHGEAMRQMAAAYAAFKREKALLDYDDLLFELEALFRARPEVLSRCRQKSRYVMIDEYQDTNLVQARLASLLSGREGAELAGENDAGGNILVVGDDAQSIYAFRGANVRNILRFPELFPQAKLIRLEENYRSTQPVLDLANAVLDNAPEGYKKRLFTRRTGGVKPGLIRPMSDLSQAGIVASRITELLRHYPPHEVAVLFRAGYQSYHLEAQLNKLGIRFNKYGGLRYAEAAHVKDAMSFMRLVLNPLDFTAFQRMASLSKGIGAKTCLRLYQLLHSRDADALAAACAKFPDLDNDLALLDSLRKGGAGPAAMFGEVIAHYAPRLETLFPEDYPRRLQGLEQLQHIAAAYTELDLFIADLALDDPLEEEEPRSNVVLSTIHSAKGLEWEAVILLDLVEDRFPSRHAKTRPEDYEEERRLMYVAVTRAKSRLDLCAPLSLYDRSGGGTVPVRVSPFVREISQALYDELQELYGGGLTRRERPAPEAFHDPDPAMRAQTASGGTHAQEEACGAPLLRAAAATPEKTGYCRHRIFGRGKIVQFLPPDKYRVHFPGMGLKVIMAAFLAMEE